MHSKNPDVRACWQKLAIIAPKNEITNVGYRKIIYDKHFSQGVCVWRGKCMFQENTWWINTVYSRTKPKFIYLINNYISFREVQNLTRTNLAWNANLKKKNLLKVQDYILRHFEKCRLLHACFYFSQQIFRPPLDHYDVIIHLHSRLLPRRAQALDKGKHPAEEASLSRPSVLLPVVNFDPAQLYLKELKVRKRPLFRAF